MLSVRELGRRARSAFAFATSFMPGSSAEFGVPRWLSSTDEWFGGAASDGIHGPLAKAPDGSTLLVLSGSEIGQRRRPSYVDVGLSGKVDASLSGRRLPRFVASLAGARYIGSCFGCVLTSDDAVLQDVSLNSTGWCRQVSRPSDHNAFRRFPGRLSGCLHGSVLVLNTPFASNYHHFLLDTVPRIGLANEAGIGIDGLDFVILDYRKNRWQREVLGELRIDEAKIVIQSPGLHVSADRMHVPSISEPVCREEQVDYTSEGMEYVRRLMRPARDARARRRLLLSRRLANCRRWMQEDDALPELEKLGFVRVECEKLSVREQAKLFGEAEIVVMPHGGGVANSVFCEPGTKIIEMFHPRYHPVFMLPLSTVLGLDYYALCGEDVLPICDARANWTASTVDVSIPADRLLRFVKELL